MEKELMQKMHKNFDDFSRRTEGGLEYWFARDLQGLLGYDQWKNFQKVLDKAKIACQKVGLKVSDHFSDVGKMIELGKGGERKIQDLALTRHACYLIAQNGDPRKSEIAFAMAYFAIQTRKQELIEKRVAEIERWQFREKLSLSEKTLSGLIYERGVDSAGFSRIRSKGDQALFGGYSTTEMKNRLGIPAKRPLADFLPAVTIKAKDLANEITNFTLKRDLSIKGEETISEEHVKNNHNVRGLLIKSRIRPEELPVAEDIKKVTRRFKPLGKKLSLGK